MAWSPSCPITSGKLPSSGFHCTLWFIYLCVGHLSAVFTTSHHHLCSTEVSSASFLSTARSVSTSTNIERHSYYPQCQGYQISIIRQSLREPIRVPLFVSVAIGGGRVTYICAGWRTSAPHKGNCSFTWCLYGKASTRQVQSVRNAVSGSSQIRKQINPYSMLSSKARPPQNRFLGYCSSLFIRLAQHITALRAWCK